VTIFSIKSEIEGLTVIYQPHCHALGYIEDDRGGCPEGIHQFGGRSIQRRYRGSQEANGDTQERYSVYPREIWCRSKYRPHPEQWALLNVQAVSGSTNTDITC
jgi:hypothetical protein